MSGGPIVSKGWAIDEIKVRSAITCGTRYGICSNCYGRDLGRGHLVNIGEAVGVLRRSLLVSQERS